MRSLLTALLLAVGAALAGCQGPASPDPSPRAIPPERLAALERRLAVEEVGRYEPVPPPAPGELLLQAKNAVTYGRELVDAMRFTSAEEVPPLRRGAAAHFLSRAQAELERLREGGLEALAHGPAPALRQVGVGFPPEVRWVSGRYAFDGTYLPGWPPVDIHPLPGQGLPELTESANLTEAFGWRGRQTEEELEREALADAPVLIGDFQP